MWLAEAKFGYSHIKTYCDNLANGSNVLEIGSGSGILLSMLSDRFKHLAFQGLEPFGDGFQTSSSLNKLVKETGVNIHNISYTKFLPKTKFDLVFSINVFEHLDDWKDFLSWSSKILSKKGKLITLCPNYGFPYESHFRIPIIYNKNITYLLFKNHIKKIEDFENLSGIWKSLNFVKKKEVFNYILLEKNRLKLRMFDDTSIIDQMILRLTSDIEFKKRQKTIGNIATILNLIGIVKILKLFKNYLPYMKLEFEIIH
tara:strand:- start:620 stop:1390 length:771 start_codon:yes stop_codon:yes gene_type:complete